MPVRLQEIIKYQQMNYISPQFQIFGPSTILMGKDENSLWVNQNGVGRKNKKGRRFNQSVRNVTVLSPTAAWRLDL